jgi:D-glycero-D-manno-heptose 1,7-bisphosphate phosphatase
MVQNIKAVIMAGGKGTRIASLHQEIPKPMIPILGKPVLQHQIECLKNQGIFNILIVIGHLGDKIVDYFNDGVSFGVNISYYKEESPLGTAGALYFIKSIQNQDFILINGDVIFDINFKRFYEYHVGKGGIATILTHPNDHPYDSGVIRTDSEGRVVAWLHKEDPRVWYKNRVNAGIHVFSPGIFKENRKPGILDLDRDVLKPLISIGELFAYDSPEYVKDMGVPKRLIEVENDIKKGLVKAKNLNLKQRAVFLDRDGTINKYVGFLRTLDDFELIPGIAERIKELNQSGYLVIVVTNQPVIARGEVSWDDLFQIHDKMETLLGEKGAYLDAIFICPHHPDKGFPGERIEYKIDCECRKPKPGLLLQAAQEYNIDIENSYMVGDSESDKQASLAAGCKFIDIEKFLYSKSIPLFVK